MIDIDTESALREISKIFQQQDDLNATISALQIRLKGMMEALADLELQKETLVAQIRYDSVETVELDENFTEDENQVLLSISRGVHGMRVDTATAKKYDKAITSLLDKGIIERYSPKGDRRRYYQLSAVVNASNGEEI